MNYNKFQQYDSILVRQNEARIDSELVDLGANQYEKYSIIRELEISNKDKIERCKLKLCQFDSIHSFDEAKNKVKELFPNITRDFVKINVGDAALFILNTEKIVRICLNTNSEFIAYDYSDNIE